jgi:hypothetical protein
MARRGARRRVPTSSVVSQQHSLNRSAAHLNKTVPKSVVRYDTAFACTPRRIFAGDPVTRCVRVLSVDSSRTATTNSLRCTVDAYLCGVSRPVSSSPRRCLKPRVRSSYAAWRPLGCCKCNIYPANTAILCFARRYANSSSAGPVHDTVTVSACRPCRRAEMSKRALNVKLRGWHMDIEGCGVQRSAFRFAFLHWPSLDSRAVRAMYRNSGPCSGHWTVCNNVKRARSYRTPFPFPSESVRSPDAARSTFAARLSELTFTSPCR